MDEYSNETGRGRGRPRKPDSRKHDVHVRLTEEEMKKLYELCYLKGVSRQSALIECFKNELERVKNELDF